MSTSARDDAPRLVTTPMVIAPDIILDLILARGRWANEAMMLFDAIAADVEAGSEARPAYMASITVETIHYLAKRAGGEAVANAATTDLLRLLVVVPLDNHDHHEALGFRGFEFEDALQFVTCRRVGAKFLVTRNDFGVRRTPVQLRTAAEMAAMFRRQVAGTIQKDWNT